MCAMQYESVGKSGQTVKVSLRMLASTIVKNPFALFMGNCHAKRIKNIALTNDMNTG